MSCFHSVIFHTQSPLSLHDPALIFIKYTVIYDYIIGKTEKLHYHLCQDNFRAMGQLSEEGIAKKIAEQISVIAFKAPRLLRMEKNSHCSGPPSGHIGRIRTGSTS